MIKVILIKKVINNILFMINMTKMIIKKNRKYNIVL